MLSTYFILASTALSLVSIPPAAVLQVGRPASAELAYGAGADQPSATVTFVLVDRLVREDIEAEILQRPSANQPISVLVRRVDLSPGLIVLVRHVLTTAIHHRASVHSNGDSRLFIHKGARVPPVPELDGATMRQLVNQIETAPVRHVDGVGDYPSITIVMSLP